MRINLNPRVFYCRMRLHRRIWMFTAAVTLLALTAFGLRAYRTTLEKSAATKSEASEQEAQIAGMFALLENDPRIRRGQTQRAVEWVATLAESNEDAPAEAFYALGLRRFYGEKDLDGAETAFRRAMELRPEWSWPHNTLGIVQFTRGDETAAMASFERAMKLDPKWSRPHSDLAILFRRAGRMDDAIREATVALEMDPTGPVTHYNYGVILDFLGRTAEARTEYETVIGLDPTLPAPYYNLACGYAREENLEQALYYLGTAIRLDEAFREEAEKDPDFDRIRADPAFERVIGGRLINE